MITLNLQQPAARTQAPHFEKVLTLLRPDVSVRELLSESANALRLRDTPPHSPADIARRLDLDIVYANEVGVSLAAQAHLAIEQDGSRIYLNQRPTCWHSNSVARTKQNFALAHEIGHFVLRQQIKEKIPHYRFLRDDPREERCADMFAAELLMPEHRIKDQIMRLTLDLHRLLALRFEYEVPIESLLRRAIELRCGVWGTIWEFQGGECKLLWSWTPVLTRATLCRTGRTPIERAYTGEADPPSKDTAVAGVSAPKEWTQGQKQGWLDLIILGQRTRLQAIATRLENSTRVVAVFFKDPLDAVDLSRDLTVEDWEPSIRRARRQADGRSASVMPRSKRRAVAQRWLHRQKQL